MRVRDVSAAQTIKTPLEIPKNPCHVWIVSMWESEVAMAVHFQEKAFPTSDGAVIRYVDEPPDDESPDKENTLLFVHGWLMKGSAFMPLGKKLLGRYRIVWLDLRGHGKTISTGPYTMKRLAMDIKALIEYLELRNIVYVGFSMGAFILYQYILDYGCLHLRSAVVMDMPPKTLNDAGWKHGQYQGQYSEADLQQDLELIRHDGQAFLADFSRQLLLKHTPGEKRNHQPSFPYRCIQKILFRNPPLAYWEQMQLQDYRSMLSSITIPLGIVYAKPGSLFEEGAAIHIHEKVPNSTLHPIENTTHAGLMFRTEELARIIEGVAGTS